MDVPKVIVITGASSGIGAALAHYYANPGIILVLIARNAEKLLLVSQACQNKGAQVFTAIIDVRNTEAWRQWVKDFNLHYPVDLFIANAGAASTLGINGEPEDWNAIETVLDTNIYGVIAGIEALIPDMIQRRSGQIVIISSLAAYRGLPLSPSYCASKAAVKSYGEALRGWLKHHNIKVTVVCPGFIKSAMSDRFPASKPFLMSAEEAAVVIAKGIQKQQACVAFPFPLNLGSWILGILPAFIVDIILPLLGYTKLRAK